MAQIVCLANSWKHKGRCIAGIDLESRRWIRPVSDLEDGRIPVDHQIIDGQDVSLLDILEIPLADSGPDFGFASENLLILPGQWQKVGSLQPQDILQFHIEEEHILHNSLSYVTVPVLQFLPFQARQTLQLVRATEFSARIVGQRHEGGNKWQGSLVTSRGKRLTATITDPVFVARLETGYRPTNPCLVTVSLSMPYRPEDWKGDDPCWKLIAGVIELSDSDLILVEMQRLGWTLDQGKEYLQRTYDKRSRQQLTDTEKSEFLTYLKSLPTPAQ